MIDAPMFSDLSFERDCKELERLQVNLNDVLAPFVIRSSVSKDGGETRMIAMTHCPKTLRLTRAIIGRWQELADQAKERKKRGLYSGKVSFFCPVPIICGDFSRALVYEFDATGVQTLTREKLLHSLRKKQSHNQESTLYNLDVIQRDIETISAYAPGTKFRIRISGYSDSTIDLIRPAGSMVATERHRVGKHGILLDTTMAESLNPGGRHWELFHGQKLNYRSRYDDLKPIPFGLYKNGKLYLLADVDRAFENKPACNQESK